MCLLGFLTLAVYVCSELYDQFNSDLATVKTMSLVGGLVWDSSFNNFGIGSLRGVVEFPPSSPSPPSTPSTAAP